MSLEDTIHALMKRKFVQLVTNISKQLHPEIKDAESIKKIKAQVAEPVFLLLVKVMLQSFNNYQPPPHMSRMGFKLTEQNSCMKILLEDLGFLVNAPLSKDTSIQAAISRVKHFEALLLALTLEKIVASYTSTTDDSTGSSTFQSTTQTDTLIEALSSSFDLALATYVKKYIEHHSEQHRVERDDLQSQVSLRRADTLAEILKPLEGTKCVAVAYDARNDMLCIGSNLDDDKFATKVSRHIHARLTQLSLFCVTFKHTIPDLLTMSRSNARKAIYSALEAAYINSFVGTVPVPTKQKDTDVQYRKKLKLQLAKIIHSVLCEPKSLAFGPDPLNILRTEKYKILLPRLNHSEVSTAAVSSDTDFSFIDVRTTDAYAATNSIHAEQLLAKYFTDKQLELPFIGVSILCCPDCWKTITHHFPDIRLSGTHGNGYPGTVDVFSTAARQEYVYLFEGSLKRHSSDPYSRVNSKPSTPLEDERSMICGDASAKPLKVGEDVKFITRHSFFQAPPGEVTAPLTDEPLLTATGAAPSVDQLPIASTLS